ncbi:hypothetical protein LX32DRAFT_39512 [Colletotrichum zoysiae]|uniref:Secreted protein n=1 Tax=Colletotrichum zoysiae TaxID=1216348 RepID=A0AAD9HDH4_9PEZI|nr:hypothetical protein LX32DRAFT_39512 [Colletotrichum zoysiae]
MAFILSRKQHVTDIVVFLLVTFCVGRPCCARKSGCSPSAVLILPVASRLDLKGSSRPFGRESDTACGLRGAKCFMERGSSMRERFWPLLGAINALEAGQKTPTT